MNFFFLQPELIFMISKSLYSGKTIATLPDLMKKTKIII